MNAAEKINIGLEEAIAFAGGDTNGSIVHSKRVNQRVLPHRNVRYSHQSLFTVDNAIAKEYPALTVVDVAKMIYYRNPSTFEDRVDGTCTMGWDHAHADITVSYINALVKAKEIADSKNPHVEFLRWLGKDALRGEMANFVRFCGPEFFVETRFGNFVWKDPVYSGDNSLTFYDGNIQKFYRDHRAGCGRDKGRRLLGRWINNDDYTLVLPE